MAKGAILSVLVVYLPIDCSLKTFFKIQYLDPDPFSEYGSGSETLINFTVKFSFPTLTKYFTPQVWPTESFLYKISFVCPFNNGLFPPVGTSAAQRDERTVCSCRLPLHTLERAQLPCRHCAHHQVDLQDFYVSFLRKFYYTRGEMFRRLCETEKLR